MVAVILTGISILVTMSDSKAAIVLKKNGNYENFLFTFEFSALLALITAIVGIMASTFNNDITLVYLFLFSVIYTVLAVATTIGRVITYGDRIATIHALEESPNNIPVSKRDDSKANPGGSDPTDEDSEALDSGPSN